MPGTAMQNAIAVVGINIGKNRSRYWITDVQKQPEKTSIARRKLLAGGVVLAGGAASAALHSICRRCRRQSAAACASMDEGTGRAVSQPDGKPAAFKVVFLQLS
jgi:hypothetical protein